MIPQIWTPLSNGIKDALNASRQFSISMKVRPIFTRSQATYEFCNFGTYNGAGPYYPWFSPNLRVDRRYGYPISIGLTNYRSTTNTLVSVPSGIAMMKDTEFMNPQWTITPSADWVTISMACDWSGTTGYSRLFINGAFVGNTSTATRTVSAWLFDTASVFGADGVPNPDRLSFGGFEEIGWTSDATPVYKDHKDSWKGGGVASLSLTSGVTGSGATCSPGGTEIAEWRATAQMPTGTYTDAYGNVWTIDKEYFLGTVN